ncbi:MAG: NTP transferase domain-containing protein [Candidatus Sericytochromatia bacterium]
MITPEAIAAVVTAAGLSTRMGRPKALLDWHGRPLVAHQVAALARLRQVVVVLGHEAEAIGRAVPASPGVRLVLNPAYESGRVSSLVAGFQAIEAPVEAVLVVGVDQPLAPGLVAALLAGWDGRSPVAAPTYEGRRGHPVLFRGDLLAELLAIREETQGLRAVTARHREGRQEVPVPFPEVLLDLNTPEAWRTASGR